MSDKTSLGDRIKQYEAVGQGRLLRRTPVIIRVDGKAFHTFTKRIKPINDLSLETGPFSEKLHRVMTNTALSLCSQIQNAQFAYTQSDEISVFLRDWDRHETQQWFDGKIQKIVSVSAAMTAAYFNFYLSQEFPVCIVDIGTFSYADNDPSDKGERVVPWCIPVVPLFDSRVFNVPKEEVCNYFIWRQQDATRNSVQMYGRHYFSTKAMHGKNNSDVQDMLMEHPDGPFNWNDLETWKRRGSCILPNPRQYDSSTAWVYDHHVPIFTEDREYIEQFLEPSLVDG